ncbi:MAG: hypothetical protein Kow0092_29530 [Deferrisomatales bacterium]
MEEAAEARPGNLLAPPLRLCEPKRLSVKLLRHDKGGIARGNPEASEETSGEIPGSRAGPLTLGARHQRTCRVGRRISPSTHRTACTASRA